MTPPKGVFPIRQGIFEVCVLGHLRDVKDPLRTAAAARLLPTSSQLLVCHAGGAINAAMATRARHEMDTNPRYRWLGELPRWRAMRLLARSRAMILTSTMEGGANVVSEALACGVPVLSSHISGSIGLLGTDYPGYFPVGDTRALADKLERLEAEPSFLAELTRRCHTRADSVQPAAELQRLRQLLAEF